MSRSLEPQKVTEDDSFYEERRHMLFVHQVRAKDGSWICADQVKIPWLLIEASLKRVKAKKRRVAKARSK